MMKFYVETSAADFFLSNLNGKGAEATRKLQISKGREWYISTTVLWELLQIRDDDDLDACMYLSSFLFSENLLKSAAEIIIDYIQQSEPDHLVLQSPFTSSAIGSYWSRSCHDKGFRFRIDAPIFKDVTNLIRDLSKYMALMTVDEAGEAPLRSDLANIKEIIDAAYVQYYNDDVDVMIKKIRTIAMITLFIQLCMCLDISKDAIDSYWKTVGIGDPIERLLYLLERHPDLVRKGPAWYIANAIFTQCMKNRRSSRGAFHDGIHAVYLPFVDIFLTRDEHFRKMKEFATQEYKDLYNKIQHIDDLQLLRIDEPTAVPNMRSDRDRA